MEAIRENIRAINHKIGKVRLVVVSKTRTEEEILEAYATGVRDFGENKVQDLVFKAKLLPKDIRWHMIGHLQRNKVKQLVEHVDLIHSVDSLKLLKEIDKEARKRDIVVNCLLQIKVADEETKYGMARTELLSLLKSEQFNDLGNVRIKGLMAMATFSDDNDKVKNEFRYAKNLLEEVKDAIESNNNEMKELSMGMTNDYELAISEGSTIIRVGSAIFGPRI